MSDSKISALPPATVPLTGTELVPLVQGGVTEQVPASELGKVGGAIDLATTNPTTPAAGNVRMFRRSIAGRQMPAFVGPSGLDSAVQPLFARNKIGRLTPLGNQTTISSDGLISPTNFGTTTNRSVSTTNLFTRTRRIGFSTNTTAGTVAGTRIASSQFTMGNGAGLGGFFWVVRFGFSALVSDTRAFFGMRPDSTPTNVEPSGLTNCIGVGRGAADSNLVLYSGGSSPGAPIDLGPDFPANTSNVDLYELALFSPPAQAGLVNWQVTRLNTGHTASGQLIGTSSVLPTTALLSGAHFWITNNASAAAVGFDLVSLYVETDF